MMYYVDIMDLITLHFAWEGFMDFIQIVRDGIDFYNEFSGVISLFVGACIYYIKRPIAVFPAFGENNT